jgi:hypothetical protein
MDGIIADLRVAIMDGASMEPGASGPIARKLTSGIESEAKAARLEASLVEALDMIPVAQELGCELIARQHALSILLRIETALV